MKNDRINKNVWNEIADPTEVEEELYEGLTLDDWYFFEFREELKDAPWYYRDTMKYGESTRMWISRDPGIQRLCIFF